MTAINNKLMPKDGPLKISNLQIKIAKPSLVFNAHSQSVRDNYNIMQRDNFLSEKISELNTWRNNIINKERYPNRDVYANNSLPRLVVDPIPKWKRIAEKPKQEISLLAPNVINQRSKQLLSERKIKSINTKGLSAVKELPTSFKNENGINTIKDDSNDFNAINAFKIVVPSLVVLTMILLVSSRI